MPKRNENVTAGMSKRDRTAAEDSQRQSSTRQTTAVAAAGVGASPRVRRPPLGKSPVAQNSVPGRHGNQFFADCTTRWPLPQSGRRLTGRLRDAR